MRTGAKGILLFLIVVLVLPSLLYATEVLKAEIPEKWTPSPAQAGGFSAYMTSYDLKEALLVFMRVFSVPHQSALEWANDETIHLAMRGMKVLAVPYEITINGQVWVKMESQIYVKNPDGTSGITKNEQYFRKQGNDSMVEVSVMGEENNYATLNRQELTEFLSSIEVIGSASQTEPVTNS